MSQKINFGLHMRVGLGSNPGGGGGGPAWLLTFARNLLAAFGADAASSGTSETNAYGYNSTNGWEIVKVPAGTEVAEGLRYDTGVWYNDDGAGKVLTPFKIGADGEEVFIVVAGRVNNDTINSENWRVTPTSSPFSHYYQQQTGVTANASLEPLEIDSEGRWIEAGNSDVDANGNPTNILDGGRRVAAINEMLQSNNIDQTQAAWQLANTGTKGGANTHIAPDGTLTANEISFGAVATAQVYQTRTILNATTYTYSGWAKCSVGTEAFRLGVVSGTPSILGDQVVTTEWQRFKLTFVSTGTTAYPAFENATDAQARTIQVWGAQLELGSVATENITTTTGAVQENPNVSTSVLWTYMGLYNVMGAGWLTHILSEVSAINILLESQAISTDTGKWGVFNSGISYPVNTHVAPDGTMTANKVGFGVSALAVVYQASKVVVPGQTYTLSAFAQTEVGTTFFRFQDQGSESSPDLPVTTKWTRFDWQRVTPDASIHFAFENQSAGGLNEIIAWGAQLELGLSPSSYIRTTTGTVQRNASIYLASPKSDAFLRLRFAAIESQSYLTSGTIDISYDGTTLTWTDGVNAMTHVVAMVIGDQVCVEEATGKLYYNGVLVDTNGSYSPTWGECALFEGTDYRFDKAIDPTDTTWSEKE